MAGFGVTFLPGAPPEAAAALALLLFGDPEAPMPVQNSCTSTVYLVNNIPMSIFYLY